MRKLNLAKPDFEYDPEDPDGFRAGMLRFGKQLGAERTGTSVYEIPPGQAICPYHYEYPEEEWLLVLAGNPTLRHPEGSERLEPWDVVFFPPGPAGAHGVRNETEEVVRVLMYSTVSHPAVSVYPDSDKLGVWGVDPEDELLLPRSAGMSYFDGEG
ncbi:MAG: cupin domain-containing protein [Solirubrobacteraceae bacterium]